MAKKCHHFVFSVKTNSFADNFYKVRTTIETFLSEDGTKSYRYKKRQEEGKTNRNILVDFDWNQQTATYRNWDEDTPTAPIKAVPQ